MALTIEIGLLIRGLNFSPKSVRGPAVAPAPPIAQLAARRNTVKVQNEGELVWEDTHDKQTLYRRQRVLTLDGSSADVEFLDGTGLQIDENSLVVLEKTPSDDSNGYQRLIVKLLRGTLHKSDPRKTSNLPRRMGENTPEIEVQTAGASLELRPTSELTIIAPTDPSQGARVLVQSGEVGLRAESGSAAVSTIKSGEEALLAPAGSQAAPTVRKLWFTPLSPKGGQTLSVEERGQSKVRAVRFRWNANRRAAAGNPQEIEVSRDPSFKDGKDGTLRSRVNATEPPLEYVELNIDVPFGTRPVRWYWRVHTVGQSAQYVGPTETFWLTPRVTPELLVPEDHATVETGKPIDFAWVAMEGASAYELEMDGHEPILARIPYVSLDAQTAAAKLTHGRLYWRVRVLLGDGGTSEWSAKRELSVRTEPSAPPASTAPAAPPPPDRIEEPEIVPAPAHTSRSRSWWELLISSAFAAESAPENGYRIRLKWEGVQGAEGYRVQISRDRKFKNVLTETQTTTPELLWTFKPETEAGGDRLFFRVASLKEGKPGTYSKPRTIAVPAGETFSALEDVGLNATIVPADSADRGDLDSLAAHPAALKRPILSTDIKPSPVGPAPAPAAQADAVAQSVATPPFEWRWIVSLATGWGNLSQSGSDPSLSSVGTQAPYLRQRLSAAAELRNAESSWNIEFQSSFAQFGKADSPRNVLQEDFGAVGWRLFLSSEVPSSVDPWVISYGAVVDHSYRWVKNGLQSVDAQGALSLGPSMRIMRSYGGIGLSLPMTGFLTGGQAGVQGWIWGEWNLVSLGNTSTLSLRCDAEIEYLRWKAPASTGTTAWALWLAPVLRF